MMIRSIVTVVFLISAVISTSCLADDDEWQLWKAKFGKFYVNRADESMRREIFYKNKAAIDGHNSNPITAGDYKMQLNDLSDLTFEELQERRLGSNQPLQDEIRMMPRENRTAPQKTLRDFPDSLDWYKKGAVTWIENQGDCGACWAFSTTGSLESRRFVKTGKLESLSKQNLMDCSYSYGNMACKGGWVTSALRYVRDAGGINLASAYPYMGRNGTTCKINNNAKYAALTPDAYYTVQSGNEAAIIEALQSGPVSILFNVTPSFKNYWRGIYSSNDCGTWGTNHAMLVYGYGTDSSSGKKFWLVKNSWGLFWGEWGYARILRGVNMCAIESWVYYPLLL